MVHTPRHARTPACLSRHGINWSNRFLSILAGSRKGDWATRDAKRALREELYRLAHGKCVYCESPLELTGYLEVEHYVAKTVAPRLAFEWTNLLPVCRRCNNAKGDEDHRNVLLKPDDEDPEPYFWVDLGTGRLQPHPDLNPEQTHRANETIRLCDLQRPALCSARIAMLKWALRWLEQVPDDGGLSDRLAQEWEDLSHPETEYKFVLRHVLETCGQRGLAELDRARFQGVPVQSLL